VTTVKVRFIGEDVSLGKTTTEIETKAGKMGSIFEGIGQSIGQGLSNLPGMVAGFANGAIDKASDLNESLSKTNTVFGTQGKAIETWAKNADHNIGLSQAAALDAAGTFGNMFTQIGIGEQPAANMSVKMGNLAADFASFHNADISDVLKAQTAAFRGEYDAVQKFVPTINAAAVETKALAMTHKASAKELTANEKAMATYQLMLEGAGAAQGDFERTSDGLANKQRIQAAEWENMQVAIGQKLLPVKMALTDFIMTKLLPALQVLGEWIQKVGVWFSEHKEIVLAVAIGIMAALVPAFIAWAVSAASAAAATIVAIAPVIAIGAAIAALVVGIIYAYEHWGWFKAAVDAVADFMKNTLWPILKSIGDWIITSFVPTIVTISTTIANIAVDIYNVFNGIVSFIWGLPGRITDAATGMWNGIVDAFKTAINAIIGLWNRFDLGIPGISLPGFLGGGSWGGISDIVPDIPYLDTGGIIRKQTLAMLHPNEAVVPLKGNMGLGDTYIINAVSVDDRTADRIARAVERRRAQVGRSTGNVRRG
jgi:hypothetical protein